MANTAPAKPASASAPKKQAAVDKAAKLRELAAKRVPKAIKAIQLLGNLAAYKPSEAQATAIIAALTSAVQSVAARLKGGARGEAGFTLPQ